MPTLLSETEVRLEKSDLLRRIVLPRETDEAGLIVPPPRSPGLHLSGLLRYIALKSKITTYIADADEEDAIERGHLPLRWFLGQIAEEGLASLYPDMLWQPGEITDPVIMNCDGVSGGELSCIEEFKCKRSKKVSGEKFLKNWVFMQQGLGYCLGYGLDIVRWHVLYLFEFPDPVYCQYTVQFNRADLAGMNKMIESNRAGAIAEGYAE
jgi:hypothetical protein